MKSEERHKLHQNALAVWLAQTITAVKPYQNIILGGIIVVILAVIAATWWNSESTAQAGKAWTQFFTALNEGNTAALEKVAEDNKHSHAAPAADLVAADAMLAQGCNLLFINKAAANQELNKAAELYQKVLQLSNAPPIQAQATFGLARSRESQGKLDIAMKIYADVMTIWPDTVFAQMSSRRLDDLKRASTKEIYDKFARYDPKPAFSQPPADKSIFDKMPEESPIVTPGAAPEKTPGAKEEKTDDKPDATKPDEKTEKPAENAEKPADSQQAPGADKPVP